VLSFTLPGDSRPIRVEGRVVWQNKPSVSSGCGDRAVRLPPGCGVQFTSLQEPDAQRIDARVRKTYPDAPMVDLTALDSVRRCRKD
jgi:hypothetical protein